MNSKRNENGIDYTPRRAKAVAAANEARRVKERHIHGVVQVRQTYPIFAVFSAGKCVQWGARSDAHAAFHAAHALPKQLVMVHEDGRRELLDQVSITGRLASRQVPLAA